MLTIMVPSFCSKFTKNRWIMHRRTGDTCAPTGRGPRLMERRSAKPGETHFASEFSSSDQDDNGPGGDINLRRIGNRDFRADVGGVAGAWAIRVGKQMPSA